MAERLQGKNTQIKHKEQINDSLDLLAMRCFSDTGL